MCQCFAGTVPDTHIGVRVEGISVRYWEQSAVPVGEKTGQGPQTHSIWWGIM
jgi:hypothetical protein